MERDAVTVSLLFSSGVTYCQISGAKGNMRRVVCEQKLIECLNSVSKSCKNQKNISPLRLNLKNITD